MHVIQSQLVNYSYNNHTQKHIKLVRWWVLGKDASGDTALAFTTEQENAFFKFMLDHPANFPIDKKEIFESVNLTPPILDDTDRDTDIEKPCLLLVRANPVSTHGICRRMDIVLQHSGLEEVIPFDLVGEIILEKAQIN